MALKRWRPNRVNLENYSAPAEHTLDMSRLDGGLNLWELPYKLPPNQSPDLLNVYWKDGALHSRQGQEYLFYDSDSFEEGPIYAHERLWNGRWLYVHNGRLYSFDPSTSERTDLIGEPCFLTTESDVSFFEFDEYLFMLGAGVYLRIDKNFAVSTILSLNTALPSLGHVSVYMPLIVINRRPDGTGGDLYEDENRLSKGRRVQFTADGTSTAYKLPSTVTSNLPVRAIVNGTTITENNGLTVDRSTGIVTFTTAPSQSTPAVANNVEIIYYNDLNNAPPILFSTAVTVHKAGEAPVVVCGGDKVARSGFTLQPNSYFWSGVTASGPDPTYFPFGNYNFAGDGSEAITAFGNQQGSLIIFKERSLGKASWSTSTIEEMDYLNLLYTPINDRIGCDIPRSVQLIDNNLVFASSERGVHVLANTSSADENNVVSISRNVNGNSQRRGLLRDIGESKRVYPSVLTSPYMRISSFDDGERYWLCVDEKVYVWDYKLSTFRTKEENLSWFLFDQIDAMAWFRNGEEKAYVDFRGNIVHFIPLFSDFDQPINRKYTFAVQHFGTYDRLKDVLRVIFNCQSDTGCFIDIEYNSDYEDRYDLTPIDLRGVQIIPRDLTNGRVLRVVKYAGTAVRIPRCFHVRHFGMTLYNSEVNADLTLIGAQIIYRYSRRDR